MDTLSASDNRIASAKSRNQELSQINGSSHVTDSTGFLGLRKGSNNKAKKSGDVIVESSKKRINKRNTGPPNNLDLSDVDSPVRPQV